MNPADAFRKEQRKKENVRNKKERDWLRAANKQLNKPDELRKELKDLLEKEQEGFTLNKDEKLKKRILQDAYDQAYKRKTVSNGLDAHYGSSSMLLQQIQPGSVIPALALSLAASVACFQCQHISSWSVSFHNDVTILLPAAGGRAQEEGSIIISTRGVALLPPGPKSYGRSTRSKARGRSSQARPASAQAPTSAIRTQASRPAPTTCSTAPPSRPRAQQQPGPLNSSSGTTATTSRTSARCRTTAPAAWPPARLCSSR